MSRYELLDGISPRWLTIFSQSMFIHPTDDYDFIIQLDPMALTRYHHNIAANHSFLSKQGKYANQQQREVNTGVLLSFDLARFLFLDLQVCLFFLPMFFLLSSVS
jgi:U3 small nucleolar RNA-associated protein 22